MEAAHIENYSGPKSQVASNGILLRRDLHALFDAHLISFEPVCGEYRLCGSYLLDKTDYASFAGATLRQPNERQWRPNTVFLEAHRIEFDRSEKKREKAGLLPY